MVYAEGRKNLRGDREVKIANDPGAIQVILGSRSQSTNETRKDLFGVLLKLPEEFVDSSCA